MAFNDPSNFYSPTGNQGGSQGTDRATMQPLPGVENFGAYNERLDMPKIVAGVQNESGEKLLTGLAKAADTSITAADTVNKIQIGKDLHDGLDKIRDEFGVAQAADKAGSESPMDATVASQDGLPVALKKLGTQLDGLNDAYEAGKLSDSYFWARAESFIRQMREKYPGYRDVIDEKTSTILGTTPANALRKSLQSDVEKLYKKLDDAKDKDLTWMLRADVSPYLPKDAYARRENGNPYPMALLYTEVAKRHAIDADARTGTHLLAWKKANGEDVSEGAQRLAATTLEGEVRNSMDDWMKGAQVDQLITKMKDPTVQLSPQEQDQLRVLTNNQSLAIKQMIEDRMSQNKDKTGAPHPSLYGLINDPEKAQKIKDQAYKQMGVIQEALVNGDFGAFHRLAKAVQYSKDKAVQDAQGMDGADIIFGMREIYGNDAFSLVATDPKSKLLGTMVDTTRATLDARGITKQDISLKDSAIKLKAVADEQGEKPNTVLREHLNDNLRVLTDPKINKLALPGAQEKRALYMFKDTDYLRLFTDQPGEMGNVFMKMTAPDVTNAVYALKDKSPDGAIAWEKYQKFATTGLRSVFNQEIGDVKSAIEERRYVTATWKDGKIVLVPTKEGIDAMNAQGNGPDAYTIARSIEYDTGKNLIKPIERLNAALAGVKPILEKSGVPADKMAVELLKQAGVNFDAGKQDTFWSGILHSLDAGRRFQEEHKGETGAAKAKKGPYQKKSELPAIGDVVSGYTFRGGNPADQASWELASG